MTKPPLPSSGGSYTLTKGQLRRVETTEGARAPAPEKPAKPAAAKAAAAEKET